MDTEALDVDGKCAHPLDPVEIQERAALVAQGRRAFKVRSEEHTSELQSPCNLVCRLLLEKKNNQSKPRLLSRGQLRFEISDVLVLIAKPLRFTQPDAVEDTGVI